jgi:tetratricopeptide (TPR) repeat protein
VQLARIHEFRLGDAARAAELYQHALATDPQPSIVFERLRVAIAHPDEATSRWQEEAARATTDPRLASGLLRARATAIESAGAEGDATADAYADALQHGSSPEVLEGLTRSRRGAALAEPLSLRASQLRDAQARALLHAIAGSLHEHSDAADREYREALAVQPDFFPALEGRRKLAEEAGDWKAAAAICAETAKIAQHPANKIELLETAAAIFGDQLAEPTRAIALYRDVLAVSPGRLVTLDRVLALLVDAGEWNEAATLIADQAPAVEPVPRAALLARRATILAERLGDGDGAIADLERALAIQPDHPQLLTLLAELHESLRHWADAAQTHERLASIGDPEQRRVALLAQARIWTAEVPDYGRAQRILEEAAALSPDRTVELRLAEVARLAGDLRRAAELYLGLSRHGTAIERATALLGHVDLLRQLGEVSPDATAPAFELALEDPAVLPILEDHYRVRNNMGGFVEHAEAALSRALPNNPAAVPLRVSLGRIFGRELAAPERAVPYLQAAVAASPANAQLRITLATALASRDDASAIAELRKAVEIDPMEPLAYQRLAQICARQGREIIAALLDTAAALVGNDDALARKLVAYVAVPTPQPDALRPDEALAILVGPTRVADVRTVVAHLDPYLHEIFPDGQEELQTMAPLPERYPITGAIRAIAQALGVPSLSLFWRERAEPMLLASDPRAFVIAPDHVTEQAVTRIRFDAAYAIARLAAGSILGHAAPAEDVRAMLYAISDSDADDEGNYRRRVSHALPRRARKDLERLVEEIGVIDPRATTAWEGEERRRALGVGVITCGDLRAVARSACPDVFTAASAEERRAGLRASMLVVEALRFATSDACWTASKRLYGRG